LDQRNTVHFSPSLMSQEVSSPSDHSLHDLQFKKKDTKSKNFRKRKELVTIAETQEESSSRRNLADLLEEKREVQKLRTRTYGVNLAVAKAGATLTNPVPQSEASIGLESQFTAETNVEVQDENLAKYIDQKLKEQRGESLQTETKKQTDEEMLYSIPDRLKTSRIDTAAGSGIVTGIVEVELPESYKLKNIEDTAKAQQQLQAQGEKNGNQRGKSENDKSGEMSLPSNFNADFSNYAKSSGQQLSGKATDDATLERYKKRFRQH